MKPQSWAFFPRLFDASTTKYLRREVDALGALAERCPAARASPLIVVTEAANPRLVCRYERVLAADRGLRERILNVVLPLVQDLVGEPMTLFKDKVNNKHPGGGGYGPHQDIVAYKSFPPTYHVTAMLTIDATTEENGCLWIADNYRQIAEVNPDFVYETIDGHPVFKYRWGQQPGHGDIVADAASYFTWQPIPTMQSDLLLFDSFLPHRSDQNHSLGSRRVMFITFSRAKDGDWYDKYYAEKMQNPLDPKFHVSTPTLHAKSGLSSDGAMSQQA